MPPLARIVEHPAGASIALALGIVMLLTGGAWLVKGSVAIARRMGVSTLLIGLTVVAFGTSAPELAFNVIAATGGHPDLSFGNIVGSNIANIGLVLGATALIAPLTVHSRVVNKELPWLIVVSIAAVALAAIPDGEAGPTVTRLNGGLMLAGFAMFMWGWKRMAQSDRGDPLVRELGEEAAEELPLMALALFLFVLGLVLLVAGGKVAEQGAVSLARWLGLSEALIGLTIVALATSLPELATGVMAVRRGHADLAIGNVVGSNIFNLLLVLGLTALIEPIPVPGGGWGRQSGMWDLVVMIAITILLLPIARTNRLVGRREGALLVFLYAAYIAWVIGRELG